MTSNGNILRGRKMFGRKMRKEAETWVAEIRCHKSSLCAFTRYIHTPRLSAPHFSANPVRQSLSRNAEGSAKRQKHGWQKYGAIKVHSAPSHGTSTPLVFLPHIFLPTPSDNPPAAMQKDPQKGKNMGGRSAVPQKLTARLHTLHPHPPRLSAPHFSASPRHIHSALIFLRQGCGPKSQCFRITISEWL